MSRIAMMTLRIPLSLAIVYLAVFSTGCAPDRQEPKPQDGAAGQAEPAAQKEGMISDQDFETGGSGQWEASSTDPDAASEEGEEEKPPGS
jgi:hypothetical protein